MPKKVELLLTSSEFVPPNDNKLAMKSCSFILTVPLAIVVVNSITSEEYVRRFFQPGHRKFLGGTTSFGFAQDSVPVEHDESTKCLSICEQECNKLNVPEYLTVSAVS